MSDNRKDDLVETSRFRSGSRFSQGQGAWYFDTREDGRQGPFWEKTRALEALESYISVMSSPFSQKYSLSLVVDPDYDPAKSNQRGKTKPFTSKK